MGQDADIIRSLETQLIEDGSSRAESQLALSVNPHRAQHQECFTEASREPDPLGGVNYEVGATGPGGVPSCIIEPTSGEGQSSNSMELERLRQLPDRPACRTASTQYDVGMDSNLNASVSSQPDDTSTSGFNDDSLSVCSTPALVSTNTALDAMSSSDAQGSADLQHIIETYQTNKGLVGGDDTHEQAFGSTGIVGTAAKHQDLPRKAGRDFGTQHEPPQLSSSMSSLDGTMSVNTTCSVSTMEDESVDVQMDFDEYSDELERLRRERQRILDMPAKDVMPSRLQVELAEAQLNYIIGQTDLLLNTVDEGWE